MTYQNTSRQFAAGTPARGQSIATLPLMIARRGLTLAGKILGSIWDSMMKAAEASSRVHRIEALEAKSDAELAKMGIKRDDIVHYVFRDLYYT